MAFESLPGVLEVVPVTHAYKLVSRETKPDDTVVRIGSVEVTPNLFTILAFVGGLSAATAMVIVETVALAIMASNDIVIPWVLQRRKQAAVFWARCSSVA